ncbi:MAG: 16S rRNA (uracil(1498)-N(3))-methyltransferase [Parachlamydiales bacterium]
MPHDRFYVQGPLRPHTRVELGGEEAHHLRVMRKRQGDTVELINGQGALAKASVGEKNSLSIEEVVVMEEPKPRLILAQALPKPNRLDLILEKGTELGAATFLLFPGERSEKKELSPSQLERAHRIIVAATKQCGRLYLPEVVVMPPLKEWSPFPRSALFGDIREGAPKLKDALPEGDEITFFVGPEGGFSDRELGLLEKQAQGVKLHPLILRTDTAPLVALALLTHLI